MVFLWLMIGRSFGNWNPTFKLEDLILKFWNWKLDHSTGSTIHQVRCGPWDSAKGSKVFAVSLKTPLGIWRSSFNEWSLNLKFDGVWWSWRLIKVEALMKNVLLRTPIILCAKVWKNLCISLEWNSREFGRCCYSGRKLHQLLTSISRDCEFNHVLFVISSVTCCL